MTPGLQREASLPQAIPAEGIASERHPALSKAFYFVRDAYSVEASARPFVRCRSSGAMLMNTKHCDSLSRPVIGIAAEHPTKTKCVGQKIAIAEKNRQASLD
jgi:hypothetical protein